MSSYGQPLPPPRPASPSAEFEIEDYSDATQAHAQWLKDSQAHQGGRGAGGGDPRGRPQQQPPPPPPQAKRGTVPQRPQAGSGGFAAGAGPVVPSAQRRPAASFELPPTVEAVDRRNAPPRTFKHALGMPSPAAPPQPRRQVRPLEAGDLEPISREAVAVWQALS